MKLMKQDDYYFGTVRSSIAAVFDVSYKEYPFYFKMVFDDKTGDMILTNSANVVYRLKKLR